MSRGKGDCDDDFLDVSSTCCYLSLAAVVVAVILSWWPSSSTFTGDEYDPNVLSLQNCRDPAYDGQYAVLRTAGSGFSHHVLQVRKFGADTMLAIKIFVPAFNALLAKLGAKSDSTPDVSAVAAATPLLTKCFTASHGRPTHIWPWVEASQPCLDLLLAASVDAGCQEHVDGCSVNTLARAREQQWRVLEEMVSFVLDMVLGGKPFACASIPRQHPARPSMLRFVDPTRAAKLVDADRYMGVQPRAARARDKNLICHALPHPADSSIDRSDGSCADGRQCNSHLVQHIDFDSSRSLPALPDSAPGGLPGAEVAVEEVGRAEGNAAIAEGSSSLQIGKVSANHLTMCSPKPSSCHSPGTHPLALLPTTQPYLCSCHLPSFCAFTTVVVGSTRAHPSSLCS